jgi:outer membrane receptor protein involved in Fe transport
MFLKIYSYLLFILVIFFQASPASAQDVGSIRGKVLDKETALEFAGASLFNIIDTITAKRNVITDSAGNFLINTVPFGKYFIKVQLIGYKTEQINIVLNSQNKDFDAGNISLVVDSKQLQTVTVTSQKNIIQKTTQGFIVNASANLTQIGGTATDLLRNTPTVVVDAEGAITMRGKSPLILINGRNSSIGSTDQIPSSSIESIEIINNPSAQYDADAEGGIINIRLKKNKQRGTNGAIALGAGFGAKGRVNSSFLLNHKTVKWNYAVAYDNRFAGRIRNIQGNRVNFDLSDEYYLNQLRNDDRFDQVQNLRLNIDFSPNAKNVWSFEAIGSKEGQDNDETLTSTIETQSKDFNSKSTRHSLELERSKVAEFAINYSHKYDDKRKSFSASISSSFSYDRENTDINSQSFEKDNSAVGDPFYQQTHNYEDANVTNIKADYVYPVSPKAVIETGYKGILRFLDANFQSLDKIDGSFIINPAASNIFKFNEQVHAAYIQYNAFIGDDDNPKWKYDAGLRAEQVTNDGKVVSPHTPFSNNYFNLFPSANIAYYKQQNEFWKLGYSRKITRPGLGQLNPFIDITDSLNQHGGNPNLKPELIHSFELGYNKDWQKFSIYSVLYYRYATNSIRQFTVLDSNGVALSQPQNFGTVVTYGIENICTAKPFLKYDFNLSVSLFQQNINGTAVEQEVTSNVFSWYGKLINNFVLWSGSKLQITGVYNSPVATPQGKRIAIYNVDMGFQQKMGKGNGRLGFVITDIFNTQKNGFYMTGSNFTYNRIGKVDSRALLIMYAYTFGTSFKEKLLENKFSND